MRLRKERDPRFVERRTIMAREYRIYARGRASELCFRFSKRHFRRLQTEVRNRGIAEVGQAGREILWWTGGEDLFWAGDELHAEDVELLVWDQKRRQDARLARLRKIRARDEQIEASRRERIPEEVRSFVWHRDDGRCVQCGSEEDLQFDHVIPHAKGGGVSADNIQVLCGACNRAKGDRI